MKATCDKCKAKVDAVYGGLPRPQPAGDAWCEACLDKAGLAKLVQSLISHHTLGAAVTNPIREAYLAEQAKKKAARLARFVESGGSKVSDEEVIMFKVAGNPRKAGSIGHKLYAVMLDCVTVGEYRHAALKVYRGAMAYLLDSIKRKHIVLAAPGTKRPAAPVPEPAVKPEPKKTKAVKLAAKPAAKKTKVRRKR